MNTLNELFDVLDEEMTSWYSVTFANADGMELNFSDYDSNVEMVYVMWRNIPGVDPFGTYVSCDSFETLKNKIRDKFKISLDEPTWYVHQETFDNLDRVIDAVKYHKVQWEPYKKESQNENAK